MLQDWGGNVDDESEEDKGEDDDADGVETSTSGSGAGNKGVRRAHFEDSNLVRNDKGSGGLGNGSSGTQRQEGVEQEAKDPLPAPPSPTSGDDDGIHLEVPEVEDNDEESDDDQQVCSDDGARTGRREDWICLNFPPHVLLALFSNFRVVVVVVVEGMRIPSLLHVVTMSLPMRVLVEGSNCCRP